MAATTTNRRTALFASGAGQLGTAQVSVTSGGVKIAAATTTRRRLTIINHGTTDVFIGVSGVTTGTGALLPGTKGASIEINVNVDVYGIVASTSQTVSYLEEFD